MTLIGLFSGTKTAAVPAGNAAAPVGDAGFAALLGAVTAPLLFAGAAASTPLGAAPEPAAPAAAPLLPSTPFTIQETGVAETPVAPKVAAIPAAPVDRAPELATGEAPAVLTEPAAATAAVAPAPAKSKKVADAGPDPLPQVPFAPVAPSAAATVVTAVASSTSATVATASSTSASIAPTSATIAPASSATPVTPPAPVTVTVSGVAVELVAATAPKVAPKQTVRTPDVVPVSVPLAPVASSGPATPVAPAASVNAPTFTEQLAKPLFTIATGPAGDHIVTVKVTPDNLGPVTVRAHVGSEGMRVELFAPNDAGREAIRSILPDLRRDLAGQGITAGLDLSSQSQPFDRGDGTAARDRSASQELPARNDTTTRDGDQPSRRTHTATSMLDVLA